MYSVVFKNIIKIKKHL